MVVRGRGGRSICQPVSHVSQRLIFPLSEGLWHRVFGTLDMGILGKGVAVEVYGGGNNVRLGEGPGLGA